MFQFHHALYKMSCYRREKAKSYYNSIKEEDQLHHNLLHSLNYVDYNYAKGGRSNDSRSTPVTFTEVELEFNETRSHNQSFRQAVSN